MADAARLALQISLFLVILGYGLTARFSDVRYLLRLPDLLVRSLVSVFLAAPVIATVLVGVLDLEPQAAIALVTLSVSPLPPLLARRDEKAGEQSQYGLALVILLVVLAVPVIVVAPPLLGHVFGHQYVASPRAAAELVVVSVLVPLLAGMAIRSRRPGIAARIEHPVDLAQRGALPVAMILLLVAAGSSTWKLLADATLVAMVLFVGSMILIGHVLGGPDRPSAAVLAFASSCRHPATAVTIASATIPNPDGRGAVALYGLIAAGMGALYTYWLRRRVAAWPR